MATTAKNSKKKPTQTNSQPPKEKSQETPKEKKPEKKPEEKKPEEKKPEAKKPEKPEEIQDGQEKSEKKKKKKKKKKTKSAVAASGKEEPKKEEPKAKGKKEEPKAKKVEEPKENGKPSKKAEPEGTKETETEGTEKKKKNLIPNVVPKMDPKEQAKLQAMFGNMQKQNARFFINETGKEDSLEREDTEDSLDDGSVDLKKIPSVYIKNCKDGKYTFNGRVTKLLVEGCDNVTVEINANILTNTMEIWKCKNLSIQINNEVRTLQLDMMSDSKIRFKKAEYVGQIIWNQIENCPLTFGDESKYNVTLGFKEMKEKYPDSNFDTDQFIVRIVEDEILEERCVRLKNGYLSTEREAIDWDKRNIIKRDEYVQKFLKEAGIALKKTGPSGEPGPNEKCTCGSGKKYKKCCQGKHKVTGVVGSDLSFKS